MKIDLQRYWGHFKIYHAGELSARIIESMREHGQVLLISKEIRHLQTSGLLDLLDELCDYYKWNKDKITIEFGDPLQSTDRGYRINMIESSECLIYADLAKVQHRDWNREKMYGMFIGRVNTSRLYAAYRHLNFDYRCHGLTSFNQDISYHVDDEYLLQYLCATNQRWEDLKSIRPWSDIDQIHTPPITGQFQGGIWNDVYEKIPIEIVLETIDYEGAYGISEKLLRPILYRRPFILIAGRNSIRDFYSKISSLRYPDLEGNFISMSGDLKFFENAISLDYDLDEGVDRVEHAFDILRTLIRTGKINTLLADCKDDIDNNYTVFKSYMEKLKKTRPLYNKRFETETWHLK
jgi:hypothetical protein